MRLAWNQNSNALAEEEISHFCLFELPETQGPMHVLCYHWLISTAYLLDGAWGLDDRTLQQRSARSKGQKQAPELGDQHFQTHEESSEAKPRYTVGDKRPSVE
jgi:hypothetical protein